MAAEVGLSDHDRQGWWGVPRIAKEAFLGVEGQRCDGLRARGWRQSRKLG